MKARTAGVAAVGLAIAAIAIWLIAGRGHETAASSDEATAPGGSAAAGAAGGSQTSGSAGRAGSAQLAALALAAGSGSARGAVGAAMGDAGSGSDDIYQRGAVVTMRVREIEAEIKKLVRQCYDNAHAQRPNIRGRLKMAVHVVHETGVGNLVANADVHKQETTLADKELLECATENVFAAEELLEKLRADKDATGGNITFELDFTFPPLPEVKEKWPADDASPECEPPRVVKGDKPPKGESQWCALPDGTKDGDEYQWDGSKLQIIMIYEQGKSHQLRMRPLD